METDARRQRQPFYRDYVSGQWSMSELCERFQVSRPTGYKWIGRIERDGLKAVVDRSKKPRGQPHRTPEHIERELLALRERYGWGATKLLQIVGRRHPSWKLPARSTVNEILDRHGKLRNVGAHAKVKKSGRLADRDAAPIAGLSQQIPARPRPIVLLGQSRRQGQARCARPSDP